MSKYQDMSTAPTGMGKFFLMRPRGQNLRTGGNWIPTVVQQDDGQLYLPQDEVHPLVVSMKGSPLTPTSLVSEMDIEWCELPDQC